MNQDPNIVTVAVYAELCTTSSSAILARIYKKQIIPHETLKLSEKRSVYFIDKEKYPPNKKKYGVGRKPKKRRKSNHKK